MATAKAWTGTEWADVQFGSGSAQAKVNVGGVWVDPCADGRDFKFWNGTAWESLCVGGCRSMRDPLDWEWEELATDVGDVSAAHMVGDYLYAVTSGALWRLDPADGSVIEQVGSVNVSHFTVVDGEVWGHGIAGIVLIDLDSDTVAETYTFPTGTQFNPTTTLGVLGGMLEYSAATGEIVQTCASARTYPFGSRPQYNNGGGLGALSAFWAFNVADREFRVVPHSIFVPPASLGLTMVSGQLWGVESFDLGSPDSQAVTAYRESDPAEPYWTPTGPGDGIVGNYEDNPYPNPGTWDTAGLWSAGTERDTGRALFRSTTNDPAEGWFLMQWRNDALFEDATFTDVTDTFQDGQAEHSTQVIRGLDCGDWIGREDRLVRVAPDGTFTVGTAPEELATGGALLVPIGAYGGYLLARTGGTGYPTDRLFRVRVS